MSDIPVECHSCGFQGAVSSYAEHKNRKCFKCGNELCFMISLDAASKKTLSLKPRIAPEAEPGERTPAPAGPPPYAQSKRPLLAGWFRR